MVHFFYILLLVIVMFAYTYVIKTEPPVYEFFKFNAAQLFTPIIQAIVFIGLAYFINIKLSGKNKQNEVLVEEIDEILDTLSELKVNVIEYFDIDRNTTDEMELKKIKTHETSILGHFKDLTNKTLFLNTLYIKLEYTDLLNSSDRVVDARELKQAVTESHFKQKSNYTAPERWDIEKLIRKLVEQYKTEKISLYASK